MIGIYTLNIHSSVEVELHLGFLPIAWGAKARRSGIEFLQWIWRETPFQRVIGKIVAPNPNSVEHALAAGMEIFGIDKRSFIRGGILRDQIWLGISRPGAV